MREQFRQELKDIHAEVVDILESVTESTREAVTSLITGDVDLAREVIARRRRARRRAASASRSASSRRSPRSSRSRATCGCCSRSPTWRSTSSAWPISSVNIAKAAKRTAGRRGPQTLYDLIQAQGNLVYRVLDATREALDNARPRAGAQASRARRADRPPLQAVLPRARAAARRRGHRVGVVDGAGEPLSRAHRRQRRRHRRAHRLPDHGRARAARRAPSRPGRGVAR